MNEMTTAVAAGVGSDAQLVARPIGEIARQTDSPIKLTHLNEHSLQSQAEHAKQFRELDQQRRNLEREHANVNVNRRPENTDERRDGRRAGPGRAG